MVLLEGSLPKTNPQGLAVSNVEVQRAVAEDTDFVIRAMEYALSPYYGGDHRLHAHRLIQTQLAGGDDARGLLSQKQNMFVLWEDGVRRGLVNLVMKSQRTCKISPLILFPREERRRGLGRALLEHAMREAQRWGARQMYCTVSASNCESLAFFMDAGFIECGRSTGQYKEGHTEVLLRLPMSGGYSQVTPKDIISVGPLSAEDEWCEVRDLFLELDSLPSGADRRWLDALRSPSQKSVESFPSWVFLARDRSDTLRAAAVASLKKGSSAKIMPLAARDDAAFRAILIDMPNLLMGRAENCHLHIHPASSHVACLQEAGWRLDAQLPDAYRRGELCQQWSRRLRGDDLVTQLRIHREYLSQIVSGEKTLEIRVGYPHISRLARGDEIELWSDGAVRRKCQIKDVRKYRTFDEMLSKEPVERALPGMSADGALAQLRRIYPANKERLGVVVIEVDGVSSR